MASAQTMIVTGLAWLAILSGCAGPRHEPPSVLLAPYDTRAGDATWGVVPLRNESGTTAVDADRVSDAVIGAIAQARGLRALPLNRTIAAMRSLSMDRVDTPADLRRLARAMGADGMVVGSITEFDPYTPKVGLSLALYASPGALVLATPGPSEVDPRTLTYQPTDYDYFEGSALADEPLAVISTYLDGKNHQVQLDIEDYARGRHEPGTALEWRRYLAIMDLFTEFAAHDGVARLLDREWLRLAGVGEHR